MAWYDRDLGSTVGVGLILLPALMWIYYNNLYPDQKSSEEKRIEAQIQLKRLETIEELVKHGPEEFKKYLTALDLYRIK